VGASATRGGAAAATATTARAGAAALPAFATQPSPSITEARSAAESGWESRVRNIAPASSYFPMRSSIQARASRAWRKRGAAAAMRESARSERSLGAASCSRRYSPASACETARSRMAAMRARTFSAAWVGTGPTSCAASSTSSRRSARRARRTVGSSEPGSCSAAWRAASLAAP
jgi:hypothetical protein